MIILLVIDVEAGTMSGQGMIEWRATAHTKASYSVFTVYRCTIKQEVIDSEIVIIIVT